MFLLNSKIQIGFYIDDCSHKKKEKTTITFENVDRANFTKNKNNKKSTCENETKNSTLSHNNKAVITLR